MKRKLVIVLSLMLLLTSVSFSLTNEDKAQSLSNMGILKGTDQGLELDQEFTRAQGAVMLVRMLGEEEGLENNNYTHPFTDVPEWASQYVGYLYQNGLANGISPTEYGSDRKMGANDYLTFVLRALNYDDKNGDFKWENASEKAKELGIIDSDTKENFDKGNFLRKDMAGVTYNGLSSNMKDSNQLLINVINERTEINTNINVSTNIDESITNTNNISNVSGSNISISTDNSDNSVNNSNNTIYDNSITINNIIDNSITINNVSYSNLEEVLNKIKGIDTSGQGDLLFKVLDKNNEPIEGAILYIDDVIKNVSNEKGWISINTESLSDSSFVKIRKEGYQQYFEKLSFDDEKEYEIVLKDAYTSLGSHEYLPNKDIYESYGRIQRKENSVYLWGQFLDENRGYIESFEIFDVDENINIVKSWNKGNYGSHQHTPFVEFKIKYIDDYNEGYGLLSDHKYKIEITRNDGEVLSTKLNPVNHPIVRDIEPYKISTLKEKVILSYSLVDNRANLSDVKFALINEKGDVIYQSVKEIEKNNEHLVYFDLLDSKALEATQYLYIKPIIDDEVSILTESIIRFEKIDQPKLLFFDSSTFQQKEKSGVDVLPFNFYGYNFKDKDYEAILTDRNGFEMSLSYRPENSDDGVLDILKADVLRKDLPSATYYIKFNEIGDGYYGSFKVNSN